MQDSIGLGVERASSKVEPFVSFMVKRLRYLPDVVTTQMAGLDCDAV